MLPYSLLTEPLRQRVKWRQGIWFWPVPADQPIPDQPPLQQYTYRRGGFWQLLNRPALYPTPNDQSVGDRPPLTPYVFRPGGYWQPQKFWLEPTPPDQPVGDRPPLAQYIFRVGGFWQTQKPLLAAVVTVPDVPVGGSLGHVVSDSLWGIGSHGPFVALDRRDPLQALLALYASGAISEDEFVALLAAALIAQ